jgi:Icc-related predicted phosphoesterase
VACARVCIASYHTLSQLLGRVKPAAAVCGHIHESAGVTWQQGHACAFINASTCTLKARMHTYTHILICST